MRLIYAAFLFAGVMILLGYRWEGVTIAAITIVGYFAYYIFGGLNGKFQ